MTIQDGINALGEIILDLGVFASVDWGQGVSVAPGGRPNPTTAATPAVWIRARDYSTTTAWGDDELGMRVRTVNYTIIITSRDGEGPNSLEELAELVMDAVEGADLKPDEDEEPTTEWTDIPATTYVERGRFDQSPKSPERTATLTGSYSYFL
jgi:hypothetical protein